MFIILSLYCPVKAATIKVDLDYYTAKTGQKIDVPVRVTSDIGDIDLRYFELYILYDCEILSADLVTLPDNLQSNAFIEFKTVEPGKLLVAVVLSEPIVSEGELFNIKFNVLRSGLSKITPSLNDSQDPAKNIPLTEIGNDLSDVYSFVHSTVLVSKGGEGGGGICFINSTI